MGSRSETKFSVESKFKKAVSDFGSVNTASVLNDVASFELAWRRSMADDEDIQTTETTSDFLIRMLTDEKDGEAFAREYFKAGFLSSAVDALFYARRAAGLTQAQVAERLNTKQTAIARLEADTNGSMSLRRYVDYALACGVVPLDISFAQLDSFCEYVIAHPEAPRTQEAYNAWQKTGVQPISGVQPPIGVNESATTIQGTRFTLIPNAGDAKPHMSQPRSGVNVTTIVSDSEKQKLSLTYSTTSQVFQFIPSMYKEAS